MDEIKNFDDFYTIKVQPNIERFVKENKDTDVWKTVTVLAVIVTIICFLVTMGTAWNGGAVTIGMLFFTAFCIYRYTKQDDKYINDFKQTVIKEIIDYLQPGLKYEPDGMIPEQEYRQSGLYRWRYAYFEGDDYIEGFYKSIAFHCSEIKAYNTRTRNTRYSAWEAARGEDKNGNLFKGLFFAAKVNDAFTGGTYIWIKGKEQLGASIADEEYRMLRFPQTVNIHTGNVMFDEHYSVYSTNPEEAHTIVDTALMNNLVHFKNQVQRNVVMSVVMGKCYVAIPVKEDLFEPADNPDDKEEIKQYFFSVLLILSIINQLQLAKLQ